MLVYRSGDDAVREALARCYVISGQERKALEEFGFLQKKNPDNPQIAFWIGELYEMLGNREKALEYYALAIKGDSATLPASLRKANLEMQTDSHLALTTIGEAINHSPEDLGLRVYQASLYMQMDRYIEAASQFDDVARRIGKNESNAKQLPPLFYFWYGSACERAGRIDDGEKYLSRYLADNPESAETLNYLAYMWADRGVKLEQAEAYIAKALRQEPDNGAYLDTLGWIQYRRGDYGNASKNLERALRQVGEDSVILSHLGDLSLALKNNKQAIRWWMRSLKVSPANTSVREKLIKAGVESSRLK